MGATQAGVILGTATYMPPEQAKGKTADRRSDIWRFGVVVYELLVGRTPFEGETTVEILGAVINREPDWSRVPPRGERLLRWCLEKDRRKRLAAIGDARMLLEESGATPAVVREVKSKGRLWPSVDAVLFARRRVDRVHRRGLGQKGGRSGRLRRHHRRGSPQHPGCQLGRGRKRCGGGFGRAAPTHAILY